MGDQLLISTKPAFTKQEQIPNSIYPDHTLILQMNHLFQSTGLYAMETKRKVNSVTHISLQSFSNNLCACVNVFVSRMIDSSPEPTHFNPRTAGAMQIIFRRSTNCRRIIPILAATDITRLHMHRFVTTACRNSCIPGTDCVCSTYADMFGHAPYVA